MKRQFIFFIGIAVIISITAVNLIFNSNKKEAVNIYTTRHYESDQELYNLFEKNTGIRVNILKGGADELIERIIREGADTTADLLITVDAGNLHTAKISEILQSVNSNKLENNIPENYRDKDNYWFGLTKRARILVYDKEIFNPDLLSTYEDLAADNWKNKLIVRTSGNVYNQSLLASFIAIHGEDAARKWAADIAENMARSPKGNDRDQAKAVIAGEGDIAIMNTYYLGQMINSPDSNEAELAGRMGIFFPNQQTTGTHVNISGIGLTKYSKNKNNAIKLMEFLSSNIAQGLFAEANHEYPVNPESEPSELVKSWGTFKSQNINMNVLGENRAIAIKIFDEVGWK